MNSETLLELYEPKPGKTLTHERQLWQSRFSPCGQFLLACGYESTILRWDVSADESKPLAAYAEHDGWVQCLGFHPEAKHVFTADSWGKLACWPYADASPKPVWQNKHAHDGWIRALAVSPDGHRIATSGNDRVIRLWSTRDGTLQTELPENAHPIFSLVFAPDGKSVISGNLFGSVQQWDVTTLKPIREFDASLLYKLNRDQDCGGVRRLAIDHEGRYLVCAGQREPGGGFAKGMPSLLIFDSETAKQIQEMKVGGTEDGFVYDAQFHPAGFIMGTSCAFPGKGHLWFWKPGDEKAFYLSKAIPNGRSLSLHPDGRRLAMTVSVSVNRNGRPEGDYVGGTSKIHLLEFPNPEPAAENAGDTND
jgi:WD domain, G-beta repeat